MTNVQLYSLIIIITASSKLTLIKTILENNFLSSMIN